MKIIEFPQQTVIIAKDQPPYLPLPAHLDASGKLICCWQLSFKERFKILFTGIIWHKVLTFNQPLQPQKLEVNSPFI